MRNTILKLLYDADYERLDVIVALGFKIRDAFSYETVGLVEDGKINFEKYYVIRTSYLRYMRGKYDR